MNVEEVKNILIVRRNGFGDLICTIPLIHYFYEKYPGVKITLVASDRNCALVPFLPFLHRVEFFPEGGNKYWKALKLAFKLRDQKFDIALSAKTSPMKLMNFFLRFIRAKRKIAYVGPKSWHSKWITDPVMFKAEKYSQKHQALKLLQMVDSNFESVPLAFYPRIVIRANSSLDIKWSGHTFFKKPGKVILLSVSNTLPTNALSEEKYSRIVNELSSKHELKFLILGVANDRLRGQKLASLIESASYFHVPENFEEFLYLINLVDGVFISDGGTAHLSAALGKGGVVYYGATSPNEWGPLSSKMQFLVDSSHAENISDGSLLTALEKMMGEL